MSLFNRGDNSAKIAKLRLTETTQNDRIGSIPNIDKIKDGIKEAISKYTSESVVILVNKDRVSRNIKIDIEIGRV